MRGTKRFTAASESAPDTNDAVFRSKRVTGGSSLDGFRPETSQTKDRVELPLDENSAELSRQHVRALNSQFASWVQTQLKNHPDELWEDGVKDYLTHASSIMEKFSDVVSWLRANASKGGSAVTQNKLVTGTVGENKLSQEKAVFNASKGGSAVTRNKLVTGTVGENKLSQEKAVFIPTPATKSVNFSSTWASGAFPSNQSSGGVLSNSQSSSLFSSSPGSGLFSGSQSSAQNVSSQSLGLFSNQSTSMFSNSQSPGLFSPRLTFGLSSNNQISGALSGSQASRSLFNSQSSVAFSNSQSSGVFSNNSQSSGIFFNANSPILFGQSAVAADRNLQDDANDDDELPQPGSPSVKKSEEKGIVVVHEVKCKLYVKSSDPSDKDTWKDRGTGKLSIKCVEGISKGTKESKPNIIIRNEVGKVLLNALLYPGIKTNVSKNSLVAIFHTASDDGGGENNAIVTRTFLIRTKTEEDRNKLATAIQEYAPAS